MSQQHTYDTGDQVAAPNWTKLTDLEVVNQLVNTAERNLAEAAELRGLMLLGARPVTDESAIAA